MTAGYDRGKYIAFIHLKVHKV